MVELAHHLNWLTEAQQALRDPASITAEKRAEFIRLCEGILVQNPTSTVTREVKAKLEGVLVPTAQSTRRDAIDLITGENVVNIPMKQVSNRLGEYVYQGINGAEERMKRGGRPENLRAIVERCSAEGPFPDFIDMLTPAEVARLDSADAALTHKCYIQFVRLCLGNQVEDSIVQRNAGLQKEIVPIVGKMHSSQGRASVGEVLRLWETNLRNNPQRNMYYRTARENPPNGNIGREYAMPMMQRDLSHFSVGIMDNDVAEDHVGAGYDPLMRVLLMRKSERPDFLDTLDTVHEMTHIVQHNEFLKRFGCDTPEKLRHSQVLYSAAIEAEGVTANGVLEEECEAFGNMIELLIARVGFGTTNVGDTMQKLNIPVDDDQKGRHLLQLLELAAEYLKKPRRNERFSREYVKAIKDLYTRLGVRLFTYSKEGIPVAVS